MTITSTANGNRDPSAARRPTRPRRRRASLTAVFGLAPFTLFLLVFALSPMVELIRLSFSTTAIRGGKFTSSWSGFQNFADVAHDPAARSSLGLTLLFVVLAVLITVVLGLVCALLVDRAVILMGLARNVLVWPAVIAPVVVSVMWLLMLSPTVGGLNQVLASVGLPDQQWLNSKAGAFLAVVAVDVWHWTPIVFLFLYTALKAVGADVIEAARIDGASEGQILRHVTLPMIVPAIAVVALLRLVMSVKAFDEMYLLTHGGPDGATNLISLHIRTLFFDRLEFGQAGALSLFIVLLIVVVISSAALTRRRTM